mgnify:CR=1 FL=1
MKHAYLVMAADEFEELKILLGALDHEDNAVFLHIDRKVDLSSEMLDELKNSVSRARLRLAPRRKVSWGGRDMLECEFALFSLARSSGPFDYYHLLSGKDLPIAGHRQIDAFFEKNRGREFVEYKQIEESEVYQRVRFYHAFPNVSAYRSVDSRFLKFAVRAYRKAERTVQGMLGIDLFRGTGLELGFGSQWLSLDDLAVERILANERKIMKIFRHAIVADELFLQTFIINDPVLRERLYRDEDGRLTSLRYIEIDSRQSSPRVWRISDRERLKQAHDAGYLFSRKFDVTEDKEIVSHILKLTEEEQ